MIIKPIVAYCCNRVFVCDEKCNKAWGISCRPHEQLSDDEDDVVYLSDEELGDAPDDPQTYEGGHGKPTHDKEARPNKWCVRECERGILIDGSLSGHVSDYSKRVYNQPWKHPK